MNCTERLLVALGCRLQVGGIDQPKLTWGGIEGAHSEVFVGRIRCDAIEYGLIAALVALGIIASVKDIGK
jgi:hypothetical protein